MAENSLAFLSYPAWVQAEEHLILGSVLLPYSHFNSDDRHDILMIPSCGM